MNAIEVILIIVLWDIVRLGIQTLLNWIVLRRKQNG